MIRSAGLLLYRTKPGDVAVIFEVLLGHMGGPLWARKDNAAWSIPKGAVDAHDNDEWAAAQREFNEEMGQQVPAGPVVDLGVFRQNRAKDKVVITCNRQCRQNCSCCQNRGTFLSQDIRNSPH
jgi:predicted NUDIX family NTP pyrophosphohydrolase